MKINSAHIAAAILAGGRNSRMAGFDKAFIRVNGAPLIQTALELLAKTFEEIIIVTNSARSFQAYKKDAVIVEDIIKGVGPLGGIHSALCETSKEAVFFMACDMPFLHNALIRRLVYYFNTLDYDALLPRAGSLIEPLCAVYRSSLKDKLANFLKTGKDYSVRGFLRTVNTGYLDLEDNLSNRKIFRNLNTPDDLKETPGARWK